MKEKNLKLGEVEEFLLNNEDEILENLNSYLIEDSSDGKEVIDIENFKDNYIEIDGIFIKIPKLNLAVRFILFLI